MIVNTCGFVDEAKQESIDAILEVARAKRGSAKRLLVAGCMVNRYGPELEREIPEIDGFIGLDDLRRVGDLVAIGGEAPPPSPSHLVFDHTAPRMLTTRGLRLPEGRRGLRQPVHLLRHPALARPVPQPADRRPRCRGAPARRAGRARALSDRPGHHPLRRGPGFAAGRHAAPGGGAAGGDRAALDPLSLRLSDHPRRRAAAVDGRRAAVCPLSRHPAPAQPAADPAGDAPRRLGGELSAPARAGARSGARHLPALDLHRRLSGRAPRALRAPDGLCRPGALRPSRGLRLQPRGGHAGGRARRPGAGRHRPRAPPAAARGAAADRPGQPPARWSGAGCRSWSKGSATRASTCSRAAITAWRRRSTAGC